MGVLELLYFAIMSRLLTKSDFGYFAAISGVMAICISLSEAGLGSAIIQKKNTSESHISTAFTLSIILGVIGTVIVFIASPWIANIVVDETLTSPLRLMSFSIFLYSLMSVGNSILYRKLNFKQVGVNTIISYVLSSAIAIIMAYAGYGLYSIVVACILNSLFTVILLYSFNVEIPRFRIYKDEVAGIVSFGGWLTTGVIFNNISNQLDKLVLSKWLSVSALGAYNRPAGFVTTINTKICNIFDTVLFPMLSEIQDNQEKVTSVFFRTVSLLNSFSIILASIFFFNAELIITIFFGQDWLEIVPVMRIVSLGIIFRIDSRLVDCFFRSLNYVKLGTQIRIIGVVITFLSLYVGAQYGIIGTAWGVFVSNLLLVLIKMVALAIKVKANIFEMFEAWIKAWKPAVLPAIVGCIYLFIPNMLLVNIVFGLFFVSIILIEFIFYPQIVGKEYCDSVYPIVEKSITQIKNLFISTKK